MSGVEIIGLILGALPLAISAVEHYRDGLDPLKDYFFHYGAVLKSLRSRLRIEQDLFEGTLHRLLSRDLSTDEAKALFPDTNRGIDIATWDRLDIDAKLRERLDDKYENFMDVIKEMQVIMQRLVEKLDVDIEGKPKWNSGSDPPPLQALKRGKWEWRKIKRSFGRKEREALIANFERQNGNIAKYVEQREILAPLTRSLPNEYSKYYNIVRDGACGLYAALEAGWKCRCLCSHNANLQLERRNTAHSSPLFNVSLSFLNAPCQDTPARKTWRETQVSVEELTDEIEIGKNYESNGPPVPSSSESSLVANSISTKGSLPPSVVKKTPRLVRIIEPASETRPSSKSQDMLQSKYSFQKDRHTPWIKSLCEAIKAVQSPQIALGSLAAISHKRFINIRTTTLIPSDIPEPVPLNSLLPSSTLSIQRRKPTGKLTGQQRLSIAVTLAHAVLQLHKSPWLNESWNKNDIYFFSHGVDRYGHPVIDHPYVSRSFGSEIQPRVESSLTPSPTGRLSNLIINKSIFALGIVLIELCLNKSFEDLCADARDPDEQAPEEPLEIMEIYSVATNLIEEVYAQQGMQYGYVVQRCLRCEFGVQDSKKRLDIDTFRALFYEGVLAPLEEDLKKYS